MGYLFLVATIIFETAAVIFMKLSDGFQHKAWGIAAVITYVASFAFFTFALKQLPAGLANAIWAGSSAVLVAVLGIFIFKEQLSVLQIVFLSLIIIGLVGLNLSEK